MNNYRKEETREGEQTIITSVVQVQTEKSNESIIPIYPGVNGHALDTSN